MTRGSELLQAYLAANELTLHDFVTLFNEGRGDGERIDEPMVSRWKNGKRSPAPEYMARIEDLTRIPMRAWVEQADRDGSGNAGGAAPAAE